MPKEKMATGYQGYKKPYNKDGRAEFGDGEIRFKDKASLNRAVDAWVEKAVPETLNPENSKTSYRVRRSEPNDGPRYDELAVASPSGDDPSRGPLYGAVAKRLRAKAVEAADSARARMIANYKNRNY